MQFDITVLEVREELNKTNQRGGKFNAVNLSFKRLDTGKLEAKSFPDWANKEVYPALQALKVGDTLTVTTEKIDGYWKWTSVGGQGSQQQVPTQAASGAAASPSRGTQAVGKVVGSNYETPAERALRQKYIIAQSSISAAIANSKPGTLDPKQVCETADIFYQYVLSKAQDFSDLQDDVPQ